MRNYIAQLYNKEAMICYLSVLDLLIDNFIIHDENQNLLTRENLISDEPKIQKYQRIQSSNYIALHQNPLNMLLRVDATIILEMFKFRFVLELSFKNT